MRAVPFPAASRPCGQCLHPTLSQIIHCIENGLPLLLENCGEELDPALENLIQKNVSGGGSGVRDLEQVPRALISCSQASCAAYFPTFTQLIKRGRALILRLGEVEVEYDPCFRLYLHTKLR